MDKIILWVSVSLVMMGFGHKLREIKSNEDEPTIQTPDPVWMDDGTVYLGSCITACKVIKRPHSSPYPLPRGYIIRENK